MNGQLSRQRIPQIHSRAKQSRPNGVQRELHDVGNLEIAQSLGTPAASRSRAVPAASSPMLVGPTARHQHRVRRRPDRPAVARRDGGHSPAARRAAGCRQYRTGKCETPRAARSASRLAGWRRKRPAPVPRRVRDRRCAGDRSARRRPCSARTASRTPAGTRPEPRASDVRRSSGGTLGYTDLIRM